MSSILKFILFFILSPLLIFGAGYVLVDYYSIIFSKKIIGEVVDVQRLEVPVAMLSRPNTPMNPQVFSFAVAIKDQKTSEIHTASAEDRQWAVVQKGQCAEAAFLPYPPWNLEKKGTFFGARLIRLFECGK